MFRDRQRKEMTNFLYFRLDVTYKKNLINLKLKLKRKKIIFLNC